MKQKLMILILGILISCNDTEHGQKILIENLSCSVTSNKYVNFKIGDEEVCWVDENPVRIDNSGTGNCGEGYEDIVNPFLATAVRGYVCNPLSDYCETIERSIVFYFTSSCNSYSTQDKFYALIKVGDYSLAKSTSDFNKFFIDYYENKTWYYTKAGNQNDSKIEVLEVNEIAPYYITLTDGSKSGQLAGLEVRLKASFNLYTENGQFYKRVTGSEIKGIYYRQTPLRQEWSDQYGE